MTLVMTLLVRDEEDILAHNIEYHLDNGVDFVIATDNLSTDRTRDILEEFRRAGQLHYIYESVDDYSQHHWVTRMARLACTEFGADWVINNDADEFWWPEQGDLKQVLSDIAPSFSAVVAERINFPPVSLPPGTEFIDVMTVRERVSLNAIGNPLPSKVCHRAFDDIEVELGNHSVRREGDLLPAVTAPITIFHFPMRSYAQFANKISKGGAALERNVSLNPSVGITWRELYKMWKQGTLAAFYEAQLLSDERIEKGLMAGHLIRDERLMHFLQRSRAISQP